MTALLACLLLVVGCSTDGDAPERDGADGDPAGNEEPRAGGSIVFALAGETSGFNPAMDQVNLSGYQITQAIYDRLVAYDEDRVARPYLAERFDPNDDFTAWTIALRPDVIFHDGTPLTSEVLKLNLEAQRDSPLLGQAVRPIADIEVVDALTVVVHMSEPWSTFPHTMTAQPGLIAAPSVFEEGGGRTPVGTGPFSLVEWVPDQKLVVERFEDYWREGYPLLDSIEYRIIPEPETRAAALESGDVDIAEVRNAPILQRFSSDDAFEVYVDDEGEATEEVIMLNTASPPFDDPDARRAVAAAIDKAQVAEVAFEGELVPAEGPFRQSSPWYRAVDFTAHDPVSARTLASSYAADHDGRFAFTIVAIPDPPVLRMLELVQAMLAEAEIEMDIEPVEATTAILRVLSGDYQASTTNALFGSTHPDREHTFLFGPNALPPGELATNFSRMQSELVDDGLTDARATADADEQAEAWGRVQEGLAEEGAFIFVVHDLIGDVATRDLRDVVSWTFPDGTVGLGQEQNLVAVFQLWLAS